MMDTEDWIGIGAVVFVLTTLPIIFAGCARCPKCHGYCTDEVDCWERRTRDQIND